jgi:hypothetical protein
MKQYLLFAGRGDAHLRGVQALVGDFDSFAEAFVSLVDQQTLAQWWHILDTKSGEVVERRHLKMHNGMIGFERSDWVLGESSKAEPVVAAAPNANGAARPETPALPTSGPAISVSLPKAADLGSLEADLRTAVASSVKNGHANGAANGKANGHANGAADR